MHIFKKLDCIHTRQQLFYHAPPSTSVSCADVAAGSRCLRLAFSLIHFAMSDDDSDPLRPLPQMATSGTLGP